MDLAQVCSCDKHSVVLVMDACKCGCSVVSSASSACLRIFQKSPLAPVVVTCEKLEAV